jgi:hypothetical protein
MASYVNDIQIRAAGGRHLITRSYPAMNSYLLERARRDTGEPARAAWRTRPKEAERA